MKKRTSWIKEGLANLIGPPKAEETRGDLQETTTLLNEAGIESKELKVKAEGDAPPQEQPPQPPQETAPEPEPEDGDVVAQVADKITEDVTAAVQGDYSQLTEDKLRALLIEAMQPAAEAEAAPEAPAEQPPSEDMQMAEDKGVALPPGINAEQVKSLLETIGAQTADQGEIAKSVMTMAAENETLKEEVKALKPQITELIEWKAQIEQALAQRPRASEDVSTIVPESAEVKAIQEAIEKGLQGPEKLFLGHIPVKSTPT
jgi:hypothetical protein